MLKLNYKEIDDLIETLRVTEDRVEFDAARITLEAAGLQVISDGPGRVRVLEGGVPRA